MHAFLAFGLFSILWLLYLLYAPASLNPAPPAPAAAAQVVAGRVTGTQARPPAGSRAWWREWISLSKFRMHFKMQLMPFWELLHVLMRVLFDLPRAGYRSACRAMSAAQSHVPCSVRTRPLRFQ